MIIEQDTTNSAQESQPVAEPATNNDSVPPQSNAPTTSDKPPQWNPTYKFKVYDKEHEMPEDFRGFIKDEVTEKKFKELFEKSYALDEHKKIHQKVLGNMDEYKTKLKDYESRYSNAEKGLKQLYDYAHSDLDTFFEMYQINPQKVYEWAERKNLEADLPAEEREYRENMRRKSFQADLYQRELESLKNQNQEMFLNQHNHMMQTALSTPNVSQFQQSFDSKFGQGAFLQHVNQYGDQVYRSQNKYLAPMDTINYIMQYYKNVVDTAQIQSQNQEPKTPPPVIPNVGKGGVSSPTKPKFKDIESLKKFVRENYSQQ